MDYESIDVKKIIAGNDVVRAASQTSAERQKYALKKKEKKKNGQSSGEQPAPEHPKADLEIYDGSEKKHSGTGEGVKIDIKV